MTKRRHMTCCCCGADAGEWTQHWNRDTGFGICARCVAWQRGRGTSEDEIRDLYGREGINWGTSHKRPLRFSGQRYR